MIRLYPQVVKSEGHIQDLRRLLTEIHHENLQQCDQLTEAALRIRELGAELGKADFDKKDRLQDYHDAKDVVIYRKECYEQQLEVCRRYEGLVAQAEAVHERRLVDLAECELQSKERWDVILERGAEHEALSGAVFRQRDEQRRLEAELLAAEESWRWHGEEYRLATARAGRQRSELQEALSEVVAHENQGTSLVAERDQLLLEQERLAKHLEGLLSRLLALDGVDEENGDLRVRVGELAAACDELKGKLVVAEPAWEQVKLDLQLAQQGYAMLTQFITSEDGDVTDMRNRLQEAELRNKDLEAELQAAKRGGQDIRLKASTAEQFAQEIERQRQEQLNRLTVACEELWEEVSKVEDESEELHDNITRELEEIEEQRELLRHMAKERADLELAADHAEKILQEEKNRCRCLVM